MNRTKRQIFVLFTFVAILSLVVAACGDEDDADDGGTGDAPIVTSTAATGGSDAAETPADDDDADDEADGTEEADDEGDDDAGAGSGDAEAGSAIYDAQCAACHTTDGSEAIGPTWQGLWMSEVPLEDGSTVTADEAYITESIREPNAKIHEGFAGVMPALDLDDDEIANVIAFIQTLE